MLRSGWKGNNQKKLAMFKCCRFLLIVGCALSAITWLGAAAPGNGPAGAGCFHPRSDLANTRLGLASGDGVRVVYLGGSITEHGQWPELASQHLARRFPQAKFDFVNAGMSSYDSIMG